MFSTFSPCSSVLLVPLHSVCVDQYIAHCNCTLVYVHPNLRRYSEASPIQIDCKARIISSESRYRNFSCWHGNALSYRPSPCFIHLTRRSINLEAYDLLFNLINNSFNHCTGCGQKQNITAHLTCSTREQLSHLREIRTMHQVHNFS